MSMMLSNTLAAIGLRVGDVALCCAYGNDIAYTLLWGGLNELEFTFHDYLGQLFTSTGIPPLVIKGVPGLAL